MATLKHQTGTDQKKKKKKKSKKNTLVSTAKKGKSQPDKTENFQTIIAQPKYHGKNHSPTPIHTSKGQVYGGVRRCCKEVPHTLPRVASEQRESQDFQPHRSLTMPPTIPSAQVPVETRRGAWTSTPTWLAVRRYPLHLPLGRDQRRPSGESVQQQ